MVSFSYGVSFIMRWSLQEGKEFLQSKGMTVTDDDVKTRGQKERLEQISTAPADSNGCQEPAAVEEDKPSMKKEGTMAVTARVSV